MSVINFTLLVTFIKNQRTHTCTGASERSHSPSTCDTPVRCCFDLFVTWRLHQVVPIKPFKQTVWEPIRSPSKHMRQEVRSFSVTKVWNGDESGVLFSLWSHLPWLLGSTNNNNNNNPIGCPCSGKTKREFLILTVLFTWKQTKNAMAAKVLQLLFSKLKASVHPVSESEERGLSGLRRRWRIKHVCGFHLLSCVGVWWSWENVFLEFSRSGLWNTPEVPVSNIFIPCLCLRD